jgi:hypothetical protein
VKNAEFVTRSPLYEVADNCYLAAFFFEYMAGMPDEIFTYTVRILKQGLILSEANVDGIVADASEGMPIPTSTVSYQKIFGSYSRRDADIVHMVSSILKTTGLGELRWDLDFLSAGEEWEDRIEREIKAANSFQLFWSENARKSVNVEKEWKIALSLGRQKFVKPVYWETPVAKIPKELNNLHFAQLAFAHRKRHGLIGKMLDKFRVKRW